MKIVNVLLVVVVNLILLGILFLLCKFELIGLMF